MLGLKGVNHRSKSRSSMVFLESCVVLSVVFRVLTCHSMNQLTSGSEGMRLHGQCGCTARVVQILWM